MKGTLLFGIGSVILILLMGFALTQGSSALPWADFFSVLKFRLGLSGVLDESLVAADAIVWSIRLPRVLMASLSGAGLALVGLCIQALVRNPMADPWLLGVSSGASLGAVLVIVLGLDLFGLFSLPLMAFAGALLASGIIYFYARKQQSLGSTRLIFMGLAISFCLEAFTQVLIFSAPHSSQVQNVLFWTLGSFGSVENEKLLLPALGVAFCFLFLWGRRDQLNILCLAEAKAFSLGLNLGRFRSQLFILSAALTSVLVCVTGSIGFVGLMIPHLLRLLFGSDHRRLVPASALGGAIFMVMADFAARNFFGAREIPIGVVTALLGSPVFVWLMRRSDV